MSSGLLSSPDPKVSGVPSTITGTILGLYNEYKDYKNGENKTWNQLFGK